jgi:hypothetical protein
MNSSAARRQAAAVVVVAILALVRPAAADATLPFRGAAQGTVTGIEPVEGGLHLTASATGQATYLGNFARQESIVLNPLTGAFEGTLVFVAADGDRLYAYVEGGFMSATTAVGTYTFAGGTGRFRNASGEVNFVAFTPDLISLTVTFEGHINY